MNRTFPTFKTSLLAALAVCAVAAGVLLTPDSHEVDARDTDGWFNYVDYYVGADNTIARIRGDLVAELDGAMNRIDAAIAGLDDDEIVAALIDAADRGVRVRVVGDASQENDDGFADLVDHPDIDVVFGNGELAYLPDPTLSPLLEVCATHDSGDYITCTRSSTVTGPANTPNIMARPDNYNVMSHTFFLIDATYLWNITAPLTGDQGLWLAFRAMSEEMTRSFEREFRQMHGGVFATTLSVYNGPLKSITHTEPARFTNRGMLRVRFNPQERLVKNVIDEIYRARSSVFLMTENLQNRDMINALRYKHEAGFEVRVLVGQSQGATGQELLDEIDGLNVVQAPASLGRLPTFVVLDSERDRNNNQPPRTVQILSHELWRSEPFEVLANLPDDLVRIYPSDTFADGVLWELVENWTVPTPALAEFVQTWEAMWNQAN